MKTAVGPTRKNQMVAVADTGFVVGLAISSDQWHAACLNIYRKQNRIFLPQTVLAETAYLLARSGGNRAMVKFLSALSRTKYKLTSLQQADIERTSSLLEQYADSRLDFVDSTVAAIAERLGALTILTTDHRDFRIIRPNHTKYFDLQPQVQV